MRHRQRASKRFDACRVAAPQLTRFSELEGHCSAVHLPSCELVSWCSTPLMQLPVAHGVHRCHPTKWSSWNPRPSTTQQSDLASVLSTWKRNTSAGAREKIQQTRAPSRFFHQSESSNSKRNVQSRSVDTDLFQTTNASTHFTRIGPT
jgi:hypothetical protein